MKPTVQSARIAKPSAIAVIFLLLTVSAAVQEVSAWRATVSRHVMARGVDTAQSTWRPVDVTDTFKTTDEKAFAFIEMTDVQPTFNLRFDWIGPDGTRLKGSPIKITVSVQRTEAYGSMQIKEENRKEGTWRSEVYGDNSLLSSLEFKIVAPGPSLRVLSVEITVEGRTTEPVYVGEILTFKVQLLNTGQEAIRGLRLAFEDFFPDDVLKVLSSPPAKDLAPNSIDTWTTEMRAQKAGEVKMKARLYVAGQMLSETELGPLKIRGSEIEIVRAVSTPGEGQPVYPGDIVIFTYELKNNRETVARAVKISIQTPLPENLNLLESPSPRDIQPGSIERFVFRFKADKEGTYNLKVLFSVGDVQWHEADGTINVSAQTILNQILSQPMMLGLVVAVVVIVVVVAIVALRRRPAAKPTPPAGYEAAPPTVPAAVKYCLSCGASLPTRAKHCTKCGASQD